MSTNIRTVSLNSKLLVSAFLLPILCTSQVIEEEFEYTKEFIWGLSKNTNSGLIGGFVMKFSKKTGEDLFRTIGFEIMNVRHPKEERYVSSFGSRFSFGKSNFLYTMRGQWGYEKVLFKKAPQQGVQIHVGAAVGPTLAILAPYFIEVDGETRQYDPARDISPGTIMGSGRLFQGLCLGHFVPGLNGKSSIIFEFGTFRKNVSGIEVGLAAEAFPKVMEIVPTQRNRAVFTSAFFTLFWGSRK